MRGTEEASAPVLWAFLVIFGSVSAGAALAFVPARRGRWLGPVRTFALTAALGVVLVHLMPEAFEGAGIAAVLAFALGFLLPGWIGKLGALAFRAREPARREQDLALEASYFGLLLHQVGDGVGLGAYTGELSSVEGSGGVVTALAAHVVPVVAIVVLTFDTLRGRGHALGRALGLALASCAGVVLARALPGGLFAAAGPWVAALVGGTLLHVVSHDLSSDPPEGSLARSLDLLAGALGFLISWLGSEIHAEVGPAGVAHDFRARFLEFAIELAPLALVGWVLIARFASRRRAETDSGAPAGFEPRRFVEAFERVTRRSGPWLVAALFVVTWVDVLVLEGRSERLFATPHVHEPWSLCLATGTGLLLLGSIWRVGLRAWLGGLGLGSAHAGHAHGERVHGERVHGGHAHGPPADSERRADPPP